MTRDHQRLLSDILSKLLDDSCNQQNLLSKSGIEHISLKTVLRPFDGWLNLASARIGGGNHSIDLCLAALSMLPGRPTLHDNGLTKFDPSPTFKAPRHDALDL